MKERTSGQAGAPSGASRKPAAPPEVEMEVEKNLGAPPVAETPRGLDYWLGTRQGRTRLSIVLVVLSMAMLAFGYGIMIWMATRGGL